MVILEKFVSVSPNVSTSPMTPGPGKENINELYVVNVLLAYFLWFFCMVKYNLGQNMFKFWKHSFFVKCIYDFWTLIQIILIVGHSGYNKFFIYPFFYSFIKKKFYINNIARKNIFSFQTVDLTETVILPIYWHS